MLASITPEEVQKMAQGITWKPGDAKEPPTLQAWEQIFNQRRKEWGYPTKRNK